jgi:hypothetical protein
MEAIDRAAIRCECAAPLTGKATYRKPMTHRPTVPARIGPVEFGTLGSMVAVRCPREFDPLMRRAGGLWEPGSRRWLIEHRRIGPVLRHLRCTTDPLFRRVGLVLE